MLAPPKIMVRPQHHRIGKKRVAAGIYSQPELMTGLYQLLQYRWIGIAIGKRMVRHAAAQIALDHFTRHAQFGIEALDIALIGFTRQSVPPDFDGTLSGIENRLAPDFAIS